MLTAVEARAISEKKCSEIVEEQLVEIERLIKLATENGEFYTVYPGNIRGETKKSLADMGYNVFEDDIIDWQYDDDFELPVEAVEDEAPDKQKKEVEDFFTDDDEEETIDSKAVEDAEPITEEIYTDPDECDLTKADVPTDSEE